MQNHIFNFEKGWLRLIITRLEFWLISKAFVLHFIDPPYVYFQWICIVKNISAKLLWYVYNIFTTYILHLYYILQQIGNKFGLAPILLELLNTQKTTYSKSTFIRVYKHYCHGIRLEKEFQCGRLTWAFCQK